MLRYLLFGNFFTCLAAIITVIVKRDLTRVIKEKNSSIKALAYQLYENNGVLQRNEVTDYLKILSQNDVRENPTEYHKAQCINDVYRSAVGRPSGVNIGVANSMLDEYMSVLTTLNEVTEIEKQQGMIIALKYIIALLEEK